MEIVIDLKKSIDENAAIYFEKSKKAKKKLEGALKAYNRKLNELEKVKQKDKEEELIIQKKAEKKQKREWYEKFRWFVTSSQKLVVLGRDATTNEILIKKHTLPKEIVMHSLLPKSPFAVIKADEKNISKEDINEVGDAVATFSQAWKNNLILTEVFSVKPEQVSKKSMSGEYLNKGAFMIYGKKTIQPAKLSLAIGIYNGKVMAAPLSAVKTNCKDFVELIPGRKKPSEVAKIISKKLNCEIDDIIKVLPAGQFALKKLNKRLNKRLNKKVEY